MSLRGAGSSRPRIIDAGLCRFEMVRVKRDDEEITIGEMYSARSDERHHACAEEHDPFAPDRHVDMVPIDVRRPCLVPRDEPSCVAKNGGQLRSFPTTDVRGQF